MGESSLLLAEASVGKNAERDSHEPGAREPSINSAAARVGGRGSSSRSAAEGGRSVITEQRVTGGLFRPQFNVLRLS